MKLKIVCMSLLLSMGLTLNLAAQEKIGFANMSLILSLMPETKTMNEKLALDRQKASELLKAKEDNFRAKYAEFNERAQKENLTDAQLKPMADELQSLQDDVRKAASEQEQKLLAKQNNYLEPVLEKIDTAIKSLVDEEGYTFIINTIDNTGTSIVLNSPEGTNVTKDLLTKLGVKIPEEATNN